MQINEQITKLVDLDPKNLLASRAYQLWQQSERGTSPLERQKKIVDQLFLEMKGKKPWFSWFYSLVNFLFPSWMKGKVNTGLCAYKFDLMMSGKEGAFLELFSEAERWILDQKLVGVFKRILGKHGDLNLEDRANRWKDKVKKYSGKREFMIGSYILYQLTTKFPNFKNEIDWMKALNMSYIEKQCLKTMQNVDDDAIIQGLIHYLELPFDVDKSLTRIFSEISYYVAKEKTKIAFRDFCSYTSNKIHGAYQTVRSYMPI